MTAMDQDKGITLMRNMRPASAVIAEKLGWTYIHFPVNNETWGYSTYIVPNEWVGINPSGKQLPIPRYFNYLHEVFNAFEDMKELSYSLLYASGEYSIVVISSTDKAWTYVERTTSICRGLANALFNYLTRNNPVDNVYMQ